MKLERIDPQDTLWDNPPYAQEAVLYNLLYKLVQVEGGLSLSDRKTAVLAQSSPDIKAWLWTADDVTNEVLQAVAEGVQAHGIPRIVAKPAICRRLWPEAKLLERLAGHVCPRLIPAAPTDGMADFPREAEDAMVADMLRTFDVFIGITPGEDAAYLARAIGLREAPGKRVWRDAAGEIVAVANIGRRTIQHACIGPVFTREAYRGHGYAAALVASLCAEIFAEGLTPVLYTSGDYPSSNRCYAKIGFEQVGILHDIAL